MESVGIRELRQNASKVLERVRAGETVGVTDHGKAVARIYPEPDNEWQALTESGVVAPPVSSDPLYALVPLPASGANLSDVLAQMREDER
jgi:prevent-host-death family protein